ncbi:MAG: DUF3789 domain-containing protein [Lachnospiraceae bacterium]|nr:DUF3789 domain-containing protein [Lachnospiraceae bacterium]
MGYVLAFAAGALSSIVIMCCLQIGK